VDRVPATGDRALSKLETLTEGLPMLLVDASLDYRNAAAIYRTARRGGQSIRKYLTA